MGGVLIDYSCDTCSIIVPELSAVVYSRIVAMLHAWYTLHTGRTYAIVLCMSSPSVYASSVTYILWLNGTSYRKKV